MSVPTTVFIASLANPLLGGLDEISATLVSTAVFAPLIGVLKSLPAFLPSRRDPTVDSQPCDNGWAGVRNSRTLHVRVSRRNSRVLQTARTHFPPVKHGDSGVRHSHEKTHGFLRVSCVSSFRQQLSRSRKPVPVLRVDSNSWINSLACVDILRQDERKSNSVGKLRVKRGKMINNPSTS